MFLGTIPYNPQKDPFRAPRRSRVQLWTPRFPSHLAAAFPASLALRLVVHLETHGTPGAGPARRFHPKSELLQCSAAGLWGLATAAYFANGKRVEVDRGCGPIRTRWRLVSCRFVRPRRSRRTEQARTRDQAFEPRQPPAHVSQPAADPQRRRQDQPGQRCAHAQDADQLRAHAFSLAGATTGRCHRLWVPSRRQGRP